MYGLGMMQYLNSDDGIAQLEELSDNCDECKYRHPDRCKICDKRDTEEQVTE